MNVLITKFHENQFSDFGIAFASYVAICKYLYLWDGRMTNTLTHRSSNSGYVFSRHTAGELREITKDLGQRSRGLDENWTKQHFN